ncbi:MAG: STAS domain-containing protein [candidate division WOR-3 bacterium]|nr:MAG: STAS domain-containing protein [candidate division WOR-3 bacterium]UCF06100.1 MAG: STAS domain-containing protein [bacterium]
MSDQFWIKESEMRRPVAVLKIGGRIGVKQARELRSRCAMLRYDGYRHLILNMSEVTFIASSGVGALIVLSGEMRIKGGGMHLACVSQSVMRVIKLLNVDGFLTIEPDEETALSKSESK